MRVEEGSGARPPERKGAAPARRFGEALRAASRAPRRGAASLASAEGTDATPGRAAAARRSAADRTDDALRSRRRGFAEEARLLAPPPPAPATPPNAAEAPATPELRALVRTLPLAVQTFGVKDGAPLALSIGRSLDVELRAGPRGVELELRPEPRLAGACEAELRSVVAALARKGILVSRAAVRVRGAAGGAGPDPRVDVAPGLR